MILKKIEVCQKQWREKGYMSCYADHGEAYQPTILEQVANCLTHGISIIPALFAVHFMIGNSSSNMHHFCALLYGISLVLLFSISTIFHVMSLLSRDRKSILFCMFHRADRFMIYIFISASYMPWLLLQHFVEFGVQVAYVIWTAAISGIVYSIVFHERYKMLETALYLCLGFAPAAPLAYKSMRGLLELGCGGVFYVLGVFFFKSDGSIPCAHAIWHLVGSCGTWVHHYAIWTHFYQV